VEKRLVEAPPWVIPHLEGKLTVRLRSLRARKIILREDDYAVEFNGEWWRRLDGEWLVEREFQSLDELERDGRRPTIIGQEVIESYVAVQAAKPSQRDIKDAMKGLEPTLVEDPMTGETREDFANVPLKNADGSLTQYAKNLIDLHAPAAKASETASEKMAEVKAGS